MFVNDNIIYMDNLHHSRQKMVVGDFYKDKKVVCTGGAGMIGSQLVQLLLDHGAHVSVIDDFSRGKRRIDGVDYVVGDVGSISTCLHTFRGAFAVFNLAARVAGVFHNASHQLEMYSENSRLLTAPVIAAEAANVPCFLQTSSVCVYAPGYNNPAYEENGMVGDPTPANAGYSEAKRDGERVIAWSNIDHAVIVRPSNVDGEFDYFDETAHVIPALIRKALENDVLEVLDAPSVTREFIYSGDVAYGMMVALAKGKNKEVYNIGTNGQTSVSLGQLAELVKQSVGKPNMEVMFTRTDVRGDQARWSDAGRLNDLGWFSQTSIEEIVNKVAKWYIEYLSSHQTNM